MSYYQQTKLKGRRWGRGRLDDKVFPLGGRGVCHLITRRFTVGLEERFRLTSVKGGRVQGRILGACQLEEARSFLKSTYRNCRKTGGEKL